MCTQGRHDNKGLSLKQNKNENKPKSFNLPDTICHNRYGHTGPDHNDNLDLCTAGKTGLV